MHVDTVRFKNLYEIRKIPCNFFLDSEKAHQDEHFANFFLGRIFLHFSYLQSNVLLTLFSSLYRNLLLTFWKKNPYLNVEFTLRYSNPLYTPYSRPFASSFNLDLSLSFILILYILNTPSSYHLL